MSMIESMAAGSGRRVKENDEVINIADILSDVYDAVNKVIKTSAALEVGDIQIGAVELKDSTNAYRASIDESGALKTSIAPYTALFMANLTLTGSAQQLANNSCKNFTIQAEPTNLGYVYVGVSSSVSSTVHMYTLSPGSSASFTVSNTNLLYVIGTSNDKICYGGES